MSIENYTAYISKETAGKMSQLKYFCPSVFPNYADYHGYMEIGEIGGFYIRKNTFLKLVIKEGIAINVQREGK